ncbi:Hypothetical predicted protein [Marmota monax]|uniref:Coiled-coil domain-containing protein 108 n=1 Tax=Marmota monax TaxID=9995 RepID=A0A5E4AYZ4_MARMO|nr:Hypothetical predicted protein [Marmota monax]
MGLEQQEEGRKGLRAFLFPSDQQIDLELWAEQVDFDSTELHQMRAEDNCIFSISPKTGSLSPGEEQMVELKYRCSSFPHLAPLILETSFLGLSLWDYRAIPLHLFVGTDRLPVLFKVSHGREILLNFIGITVKLEQKYVLFTSTSHQFIPVPIGNTLPPRQIYELYNGGSVPVTYEVQTSVLSQVQEKSFDHPIFCCINPKGEIQPGTTARVLWIFSPIEAKTYTVDVPIHILGWNSALIRFQGVGYDPCVMGDTAPFHSISSWDNSSIHCRMMVPGQAVFLSQSHISLGNIPVQSKCSRLLFLNNISKNESIVFSWQPRPLDFGEVYRQELMKQYHKELQEWTDAKVRQEAEFTITDKKVKTLPPIKNKQSLNWPASWNLKITKEETSWPCPQPPTTGMLCLSLSARAHPTDYFLDNFFSEFSCHFLHRELPGRKTPREESEASEEEFPNKGTLVYKQKKQLLVDCLTNIIRGMLEDKNFHKAVDQILVEQVPYFCQFWNEQSARFMVQKSNLYLVPNLSPPSSTCEEEKSKEQEKDRQGLGEEDQWGLGEEDKWGLGEEDESGLGKKEGGEEEEKSKEEEEELEEEEEEEETEEEELGKEEIEEEEIEGKETSETWKEIEPTVQPEFQTSLQWQWRPDLKTLVKEEQEHENKEAIGRLPAFANLQEALLENMIQNILVEASRGEVVLTSRPRIIALPPLSVPRLERLQGRAGTVGSPAFTPIWGFLSSRKPTLDPLLPTQQEEVTVPVAPPPPDSLLATVPSLSDMPT